MIHRILLDFDANTGHSPSGASTFSFLTVGYTAAGSRERVAMDTSKLVMLCPREVVSLDVSKLVEAEGSARLVAEDAVEEMVVRLAAIEAAWSAGEFNRLRASLAEVAGLAARSSLLDVAMVAEQAIELAEGRDEVALAAVVARLVRVGELSLATLLEISYRQS